MNSSPALFFALLIESIKITDNSVPAGTVAILGAAGAGAGALSAAATGFAADGAAMLGAEPAAAAGCPGVAVASGVGFELQAHNATPARMIIAAIRDNFMLSLLNLERRM
jgi:hypothetical protein